MPKLGEIAKIVKKLWFSRDTSPSPFLKEGVIDSTLIQGSIFAGMDVIDVPILWTKRTVFGFCHLPALACNRWDSNLR